MLIREVRIEDAEDITLLNKKEMGYDYPYETTKQQIMRLLDSEKDKLFVAEEDGQIVGYIHALDYDMTYNDHMKNIVNIAVKENKQKWIIGKSLVEEVEKWAKETGASAVRLVSGEHRIATHEFYKLCGYERVKTQVNLMKKIK